MRTDWWVNVFPRSNGGSLYFSAVEVRNFDNQSPFELPPDYSTMTPIVFDLRTYGGRGHINSIVMRIGLYEKFIAL